MHIDETLTQHIPLGSPQKQTNKQKITTTSFWSENSFFLSAQQLLSPALKDQGKRGTKEKLTEIDISWYSVYKRNVIPSKPNQKLSIFLLGFYYFFHSIHSIFKYFFKVF